jgi:hypothetical protein
MLIQNYQVDLDTPTGIMRSYVYHPKDVAENGEKIPWHHPLLRNIPANLTYSP